MLRTLLESNAPRQRGRGSTLASIAIHTAIIVGAIVATASANPEARPAAGRGEMPPIYVPVLQRERPHETAAPQRRNTTPWPKEPLPWPKEPIPFDDVTLKFDERNATAPLGEIDPGRFLAADTLGRGGQSGRIGGEFVGPALGDHPATIATVDKAAALTAPVRPRYPDQLRAAGVTGRVVVRLVVDATGRVEPGSVTVRESSHDLFTQAVRAVLPALQFAPAEAGGRKVRMLVDLPFEFRLKE
jgi:protein TonB